MPNVLAEVVGIDSESRRYCEPNALIRLGAEDDALRKNCELVVVKFNQARANILRVRVYVPLEDLEWRQRAAVWCSLKSGDMAMLSLRAQLRFFLGRFFLGRVEFV